MVGHSSHENWGDRYHSEISGCPVGWSTSGYLLQALHLVSHPWEWSPAARVVARMMAPKGSYLLIPGTCDHKGDSADGIR